MEEELRTLVCIGGKADKGGGNGLRRMWGCAGDSLEQQTKPCHFSLLGGFMQAAPIFVFTREIALVTGASSGLGRRFAHVLAAHGAKVVLAARRADRLAALCLEIGAATQAISLDVTEGSQISGAFDRAETVFGPVTILVNNAGT